MNKKSHNHFNINRGDINLHQLDIKTSSKIKVINLVLVQEQINGTQKHLETEPCI